jgi:phosphoglucosamine mutase
MYQGGQVVVGYDARISSPMLEAALSSGLIASGADVLQVGLVPTPVTAWMIGESRSDAGVEITASHNPPPYNGLKIFNGESMSFTINQQLATESILENESYEWAEWNSIGMVEEVDGIEPYVEMLTDTLVIERETKVVLDCFYGATSTLAPAVFTEFPIESIILNAIPDGNFPAGNPEPNRDNLMRVGRYMKAINAEIGFGFDGDGDRMMPVGADGLMVNPDKALAAYAGYVVEKNGGGTVVTHVGASMNVDDVVTAAGGKVVRTPVGDAFITEEMRKQKAVFGGEPVGAWIFPEHHMCPAGVLGALKLLKALEDTEKNLEEFIAVAPEYPLKRVKIECSEKKKPVVMKNIVKGYTDVYREVESVSTVDGVRFEMENGWALIRPSGTEPLIRITVEGRTMADVESIMDDGKRLVMKVLGELS